MADSPSAVVISERASPISDSVGKPDELSVVSDIVRCKMEVYYLVLAALQTNIFRNKIWDAMKGYSTLFVLHGKALALKHFRVQHVGRLCR